MHTLFPLPDSIRSAAGAPESEAPPIKPAPDAAGQHPQNSSASLFARALRGDSDAASQLYAETVPPLRAWLASRMPFHAAEETAHDALVEAFRRHHQFVPGSAFQAWLRTIAWHRAQNARRGHLRRQLREQLYAQHEHIEATAGAAASPYVEMVDACVAALPAAQRELLRLRFHEGWTDRQIAESHGRSRVAVAVNLHRICKGLRAEIQRTANAAKPQPADGPLAAADRS